MIGSGLIVRVRGKGEKRALVPVGQTGVALAIRIIGTRSSTRRRDRSAVLLFGDKKSRALAPVQLSRRLKQYLAIAGLDPADAASNCGTVMRRIC